MPYKDDEERRAAQRAHYQRNREVVIAKVAERKHKKYAGVCRHCGGPTVGQSKNDIPDCCSKPACKSAEYKGFLFRPKGVLKTNKPKRKKVMTIDELNKLHTPKMQRWERQVRGARND